jgi:hypothetical protein
VRDQIKQSIKEIEKSEKDQEVREISETTKCCFFSERHGCIVGPSGLTCGVMCFLVTGLGLTIPLVLIYGP